MMHRWINSAGSARGKNAAARATSPARAAKATATASFFSHSPTHRPIAAMERDALPTCNWPNVMAGRPHPVVPRLAPQHPLNSPTLHPPPASPSRALVHFSLHPARLLRR